jgi:hypothetical protein
MLYTQQTACISLNSINWFVILIVKDSVLCAVQNDVLYTVWMGFNLHSAEVHLCTSPPPSLASTVYCPLIIIIIIIIIVIFTAKCWCHSAQTALCLITFCNVIPCSLVNAYWLLEGTCFFCLLRWRWGQRFYPERWYEHIALRGVSF